MESLAYLHASCAYETSTSDAIVSNSDEPLASGLQWNGFSSGAGLRLLSLLVGLMIVGMADAAIAATLQKGDSGSEVVTLQQSLSRLGYFDGPQTGYFGSLTQEALMRFQRDFGLMPDGVLGSQTQAALEKRLASSSTGAGANFDIADVQRKLQNRGYYDGRIDGIYGSATRTAVTNFQRDFGLTPDGIVGSRTLAALNANSAIGGDTELPTSGQDVTVSEIQRLLRDKGYYDGSIDGVYGPTTRSAVISFQRDYGLKADGVVGSQTLQALRSFGNNKNLNTPPFTSTAPAPISSETSQGRYIVVIPYQNSETLVRVQQIIPDAFLADSRRGTFVQAGSFRDRASAENRANILRSQGLDARVN
jgi:peptidoglycan hydrolase-like protein with peptidoglycan-binding domain